MGILLSRCKRDNCSKINYRQYNKKYYTCYCYKHRCKEALCGGLKVENDKCFYHNKNP